jgi:exosome complex component RRP42
LLNLFLVLEVGGNLVDASSIAVKAALRDTRLPLLNIEKGDEDEYDIQVSDDPLDGEELDIHPPLTVTVAKLGHRYIVDPTDEEEAVTLASLIVSVNVSSKFRFIFDIFLGKRRSSRNEANWKRKSRSFVNS